MRPLRARGPAKLGKVAYGSATQGLWLRDRKVGSLVSGEDRSRLPGRGTVGEVRRGGREAATERRREYADLGLDFYEREEQVVCHATALAMTKEAR